MALSDFYKNSGLQNYVGGVKKVASGIASGVKDYVTSFNPLSAIKQGVKTPAMPALSTLVGATATASKALAPKPAPAKSAASITAPVAQPQNLTQSAPSAVKTPQAQQSFAMNSMIDTPSTPPMVAGASETAPQMPLQAPTIPVDSTSTLREALLSTYNQTPEENASMKSLAALNESFRLGQEGIAEQRIPLTDIQGQAASAERRYLGRADTLKDTIALQQAERLAKQQRAAKELEFAGGEKPIEVNGRLVQRQADGTYKEIFAAGTKADEGFTLGEGQVRYDANGNPIAGTPKTTAGAGEVSKQTLGLVNQLLGAGNLGSITGLIQSPASLIPGSSQQLLKNTYNQLKSLLSLENRTLLKGSGAISDYEARTLEKAATKLGRNLSDKDFVAVLQELQRDLQAGGTSGTGSVTLPSGEVINTNW